LLFLFLSTCCLPSFSITNTTTTLPPSTSKPHRLVSKTIHHPRYYINETAIDEMIKYTRMHFANMKATLEVTSLTCQHHSSIDLLTNSSHQKQQLEVACQPVIWRLKCNGNCYGN
jgi:hypothetical protein